MGEATEMVKTKTKNNFSLLSSRNTQKDTPTLLLLSVKHICAPPVYAKAAQISVNSVNMVFTEEIYSKLTRSPRKLYSFAMPARFFNFCGILPDFHFDDGMLLVSGNPLV